MNNPIDVAMELTGLSADNLSKLMNVSKTTINNYRNKPASMGIDELSKLSVETGISLNVLLGAEEKNVGPDLEPVFYRRTEKINKAIEYAQKCFEDMKNESIDDKYKYVIEKKSELLGRLDSLIKQAKILNRKPLVGALGPSDSGKSSLMNYFLRTTIIPAGYTPLTTIPTYIMHMSERISILDDVADNAVVFGRPIGSDKEPFTHEMLLDKDLSKTYVIRKGNAESILKDFGTREGAYYENETWEIDEIVIYLDCDILKEVTLVDLPGFGTGDRAEDDISLTMDMKKYDFLFFLSPADGFMRASEASAFLEVLRSVGVDDFNDEEKALRSVFLLTTHCKTIELKKQRMNILRNGCIRFVNMMSEKEKKRLGISDDDFEILEKRFIGFDNASKPLCKEFNEIVKRDFSYVSSKKIDAIMSNIMQTVQEFESACTEELGAIRKGKGEKYSHKTKKGRMKKISELSESILKKTQEDLGNNVAKHANETRDGIKKTYDRIINAKYIEEVIKRKKLGNNKRDIELLSNYLSSELEDAYIFNVKKNSDQFSDEVNKAIDGYKTRMNELSQDLGIRIDGCELDYDRAFASGLDGTSMYGALAMWVTKAVEKDGFKSATFTATKVVSALAALGVVCGESTAAVSAFSIIGGPVTFGAALALLAAVAVFGAFTGTWTSRVANKIVKTYNEERIWENYEDHILSYWTDTMNATKRCLASLGKDTIDYYESYVKKEELSDEDIIVSGMLIENLLKKMTNIALQVKTMIA